VENSAPVGYNEYETRGGIYGIFEVRRIDFGSIDLLHSFYQDLDDRSGFYRKTTRIQQVVLLDFE
jgi:hypothetical protein